MAEKLPITVEDAPESENSQELSYAEWRRLEGFDTSQLVEDPKEAEFTALASDEEHTRAAKSKRLATKLLDIQARYPDADSKAIQVIIESELTNEEIGEQDKDDYEKLNEHLAAGRHNSPLDNFNVLKDGAKRARAIAHGREDEAAIKYEKIEALREKIDAIDERYTDAAKLKRLATKLLEIYEKYSTGGSQGVKIIIESELTNEEIGEQDEADYRELHRYVTAGRQNSPLDGINGLVEGAEKAIAIARFNEAETIKRDEKVEALRKEISDI